MSREKTPGATRREREVQKHILKRIELALRGRSWNWLAQKSNIPQGTLQGQTGRRREGSDDDPNFSLPSLIEVAHALGKPLCFFLPEGHAYDPDLIALNALREIGEIVDRTRIAELIYSDETRGVRPAGIARGQDIEEEVEPLLPPREQSSTCGEPSPDLRSHKSAGERPKSKGSTPPRPETDNDRK